MDCHKVERILNLHADFNPSREKASAFFDTARTKQKKEEYFIADEVGEQAQGKKKERWFEWKQSGRGLK